MSTSACACQLPAEMYGAHGWHWLPDPKFPNDPQRAIAQERCEPYMRALRERLARERVMRGNETRTV